jgi:hypothetical protein
MSVRRKQMSASDGAVTIPDRFDAIVHGSRYGDIDHLAWCERECRAMNRRGGDQVVKRDGDMCWIQKHGAKKAAAMRAVSQ